MVKNTKSIRNLFSLQAGEEPPERPHLLSVLRSRKIVLRVLLIAACFICCTFVYNGTIINSTSVSGNKYLNFSALLLVQVPTRIITALTLTRFGRKAPICVAYTLCCVFFISSAFIPKCKYALFVVFLFIFFLAIMCIYVYYEELFFVI